MMNIVKVIPYMTRKNMPFLSLVEEAGVDLGRVFLGLQGDLGSLGDHLETGVSMSKASTEEGVIHKREVPIKEVFLRIEGATLLGDLSTEGISPEERGSMEDPILGDLSLQEGVMIKKHH